jgi:hypothetical protein
METEIEVAPNRSASWIVPFERFMDYTSDLAEMTDLTIASISVAVKMPKLAEIRYRDKPDPERLARVQRMAALAASEIERDFPFLFGHGVIGLWGALESLIEDVFVAWIDQHPEVLAAPAIAKIRIPLAEYEMLDRQDRCRLIVAELQRDLRADLKSGATKFETLLKVINLDGPVDSGVRSALFEAQQLRNVLAHRGGIADRKFVAACPHSKYKIGDVIGIGSEDFGRIIDALIAYGMTVYNRCCRLDSRDSSAVSWAGSEGDSPPILHASSVD